MEKNVFQGMVCDQSNIDLIALRVFACSFVLLTGGPSVMKKNTSLNAHCLSLHQKGINMVDLMMWLVIAAILLAAAIQGVGYYRESVILYHLKNDAIGAAANVKSSSAQDQGIIDQSIVDAGLENTRWSENTSRFGKSHSASTYSITVGNPEITKSVVYCSTSGITVVLNADLAAFSCGGSIVAGPPIIGGDPGDGTDDGSSESIFPSGSLAGWGTLYYGQMGNGPLTYETVYGPLRGKTMSMIQRNNLGGCVMADGDLWCWKSTPSSNDFSPVNMQKEGSVLYGKTITQFTLGNQHQCVIADGDGYCWGANTNGELGIGTFIGTTGGLRNPAAPVAVSKAGALNGKTLKEIKISEMSNGQHTCAVDTGNKVYCWGYNGQGQLGIGSLTRSSVPVAVNGALTGLSVTTVSLSYRGTCALDTTGSTYCWGTRETTGTIGGTAHTSPVRTANTGVLTGKTISAIHGVAYGVCAVSEGLHYCWGGGAYAVTLNATQNAPRLTMSGIPAGLTVVKMDNYSLLMSDGKVYFLSSAGTYNLMSETTVEPFASAPPITDIAQTCIMYQGEPWCDNSGMGLRQVSGDKSVIVYNAPLPLDLSSSGILSGKKFTDIDSENEHTCGVADGAAYCWGRGSYGNLGDGTNIVVSRYPVAVTAPSGIAANTVTGGTYSCATFDGVPYCWGDNAKGQLGNGTFTNASLPTPVDRSGVLAGKTVKIMTSGYNYVCILDDTSAIYCWGANTYGQLGNGTTTSSNTPVLINGSGILSGKTITDLTAGDETTCAVADGSAYCWGWNDGIFDDPADVITTPKVVNTGSLSGKTVTSVQTGYDHVCALTSDQTVHCWGNNYSGQIGNGTTDSSFDPIQIGLSGVTMLSVSSDTQHSCALSSTGLSCWGYNGTGQLGIGTEVDSLVPVAVQMDGFLSGKTIKYVNASSGLTFVFYE